MSVKGRLLQGLGVSNTNTATIPDIQTTTNQTLEPYVGPRPFKSDRQDRLRFFGRDTETDEIVSLITSHRLVLIYAQSGAGKTSIFNAQVTPALESYGFKVLPLARVQVTTDTTTDISANATTTANTTNTQISLKKED